MQVRPSVVIWFHAAVSAALLGIVVLVLGDTEGSGATRACARELRRRAAGAGTGKDSLDLATRAAGAEPESVDPG